MPAASDKVSYICACSAAGQLGLMSLYETMFSQFDITTSQLLVTSFDFTSIERRRNIQYVISQLLALGIVPLLNENDAVSANQGYESFGNTFSDNDSLASLVSIEMNAQLLILLTDVKGVYDRPPSDPESQLINVFNCDHTTFKVGEKSLQGRGGMGAKVDAALSAVHGGVQAVVIAAGLENGVIECIMGGDNVGTIFLSHPEQSSQRERGDGGGEGGEGKWEVGDGEMIVGSIDEGLVASNGRKYNKNINNDDNNDSNDGHSNGNLDLSDKDKNNSQHTTTQLNNGNINKNNINTNNTSVLQNIANESRKASRNLQLLKSEERVAILHKLAYVLEERTVDILAANAIDVEEAEIR